MVPNLKLTTKILVGSDRAGYSWLFCTGQGIQAGIIKSFMLAGIVMLFLFPTTRLQAQSDFSVPAELLSRLEEALAAKLSLEQRLDVIKEIDAILADKDCVGSEIWVKTRFVEAVTSLQKREIDDSFDQIRKLEPYIDRKAMPELWFRCSSARATLLLNRGDTQDSLQAYERLLSDVRIEEPPLLRRTARS